jgi:DNA excision repair protein ERCC-5
MLLLVDDPAPPSSTTPQAHTSDLGPFVSVSQSSNSSLQQGMSSEKPNSRLIHPPPSGELAYTSLSPQEQAHAPVETTIATPQVSVTGSLLAPEHTLSVPEDSAEEDMEEVDPPVDVLENTLVNSSSSTREPQTASLTPNIDPEHNAYEEVMLNVSPASVPLTNANTPEALLPPLEAVMMPTDLTPAPSRTPAAIPTVSFASHAEEEDEDAFSGWSRSPSPSAADLPQSATVRPDAPAQDWDAAQEMDAQAEEGEFARFVSHVKGKDLHDVQAEIDEEIRVLHAQRKAAMRDAEDVTTQMVSQIMVCPLECS